MGAAATGALGAQHLSSFALKLNDFNFIVSENLNKTKTNQSFCVISYISNMACGATISINRFYYFIKL